MYINIANEELKTDEQLLKLIEKLKYNNNDRNLNFIFDDTNNLSKTIFNLSLVKKIIFTIKKHPLLKFYKFDFRYILNDNYILNTNECKKLEQIDDYLSENYNLNLQMCSQENIDFPFTFKQTLKANRDIKKVASKIKNATTIKNGEKQKLSPFEKLMIAYEYVTNFAYNDNEYLNLESRHWVPVLNGDYIVCAGYASLMKVLCEEIFSEEEVKVFLHKLDVHPKKRNNHHQNNIIYIKDDKYNIDGLFYLDSCWDSIDRNKEKHHSYFCLPIKDILQLKNHNLQSTDSLISLYLSQFDKYRYKLKKDEMITKTNNILLDKNSEISAFIKKHFTDYILIDDTKITTEENKILDENIKNKLKIYDSQLKKLKEIKYYYSFQEKHISQYLKNLYAEKSANKRIELLEKIYENIPPLSSEEKKLIDIHKIEATDISSQIYDRLFSIEKDELEELFLEEKKKRKTDFLITNEENLLKFLNGITSSIIPIEAFENAFEILGKKEGYRGTNLKEYIENEIYCIRLDMDKKYNLKNCINCFNKTIKR